MRQVGFALLGVVLFGSANVSATLPRVSIDFDVSSDGLCFFNADPGLKKHGPLGVLGSKRGVCQGIAGIASAFYTQAEFDPAAEAPESASEARKLVRRVIRRHMGNCRDDGSEGSRVRIPGYADLDGFCRDFRDEFLKASVHYNADIAMREILRVLPRFLSRKDEALRTPDDRRHVLDTLKSIHARLSRGEAPLLMYYSHVVMVTGLRFVDSGGRPSAAYVEVYDSNVAESGSGWMSSTYERYVPFDADGLPSPSNVMIWDVTPDRRLKCR